MSDLDLDAIEMRAARADNLGSAIYTLELDVPALVAEVRRLREQVARSDEWLAAANAVIRGRAVDEIADGLDEWGTQ